MLVYSKSHPMFSEFSSNKGKPNDRSHSFSDSSELDSESNL